MNKIYLSLIFCFSIISSTFAQYQISGKITASDGEVVPFASIYIKNTTKGVSANVDGIYKLTVNKGTVTLIFKAIGYKSAEKTINVTANTTANEVLTTESYTLNSVVIKANAEDPAYEIIRQAIKNRKKQKHLGGPSLLP